MVGAPFKRISWMSPATSPACRSSTRSVAFNRSVPGGVLESPGRQGDVCPTAIANSMKARLSSGSSHKHHHPRVWRGGFGCTSCGLLERLQREHPSYPDHLAHTVQGRSKMRRGTGGISRPKCRSGKSNHCNFIPGEIRQHSDDTLKDLWEEVPQV